MVYNKNMAYTIVRRPTEVWLSVHGKTMEKLFAGALMGMMEIMDPLLDESGKATKRLIAVQSSDETRLLVDFLNEALVYAHARREAYTEVDFVNLSGDALEVELQGMHVVSFVDEIVAVSHHEAKVRQKENGEWEATVVFDI